MPWAWMGSERSSLYLSCQEIVNVWPKHFFCETRSYIVSCQTLYDEVWSISLCKRSRGLACSIIVTFGLLGQWNFSLSSATELLALLYSSTEALTACDNATNPDKGIMCLVEQGPCTKHWGKENGDTVQCVLESMEGHPSRAARQVVENPNHIVGKLVYIRWK